METFIIACFNRFPSNIRNHWVSHFDFQPLICLPQNISDALWISCQIQRNMHASYKIRACIHAARKHASTSCIAIFLPEYPDKRTWRTAMHCANKHKINAFSGPSAIKVWYHLLLAKRRCFPRCRQQPQLLGSTTKKLNKVSLPIFRFGLIPAANNKDAFRLLQHGAVQSGRALQWIIVSLISCMLDYISL